MNDFYVYMHMNPAGEIFYVGRGRGRRAGNFTSGRSKEWLNAAARGVRVKYVRVGLDHFSACVIEVQTIADQLEAGSPLVNQKLLIRRQNVVARGIDGNYAWRNVVTPYCCFCSVSKLVEEGSDPTELNDLLLGKIAVTSDGWIANY